MNFTDTSLEPNSVSSLRLPVMPGAPSSAPRLGRDSGGRSAWVDDSDQDVVQTPEMRTHLAERFDRLRPGTAGMFAGAAAGMLMLATADRLLHQRADAYDLVHFIGRLVSNGVLVGTEAHAAGFGAALLAGAFVGVVFAMVTRHLRRFAPLLLWSLVFFPAAWTLLQAFVLPVAAPWLVPLLPYVPMLAGSAVFGAIVSLQLPLRKGKEPAPF